MTKSKDIHLVKKNVQPGDRDPRQGHLKFKGGRLKCLVIAKKKLSDKDIAQL